MAGSAHTSGAASWPMRSEGWPIPLRFASAPSLVTLGALAVVAAGNAFWSTHLEWKTLRSAILFSACLLILVSRARIGKQLAVFDSAAGGGIAPTGRRSAMSRMTIVMIGVALFLVVLAGELVPDDVAVLLHVRLILLTPACVLLLYNWHRARQLLLLKAAALGTDLVETRGEFALESLLFRGTWIAVCAVAVLAIGNALWGSHQPWVSLRPVIYCGAFFAILWQLHGGIGDVLSQLAGAILDERRRVHGLSREWAADEDTTRDQSWSTRAILEALDLEPGMRIADVGAGGGYFAIKIAEIVGPTGLLVASDISPLLVTRLREQAQRRGLTQLRVQLVDPPRPLPTFEQLDRVLVANVYLFSTGDEDRSRALLEQLAGNLRPGGKLLLYSDFVHEAGWVASPEWPPLAASEADARTLIRWSEPWCDLLSSVQLPPPPPDKPLAAHEKSGYLIVLKRRG